VREEKRASDLGRRIGKNQQSEQYMAAYVEDELEGIRMLIKPGGNSGAAKISAMAAASAASMQL